ncbi:VWA domain-containing protein [Marinibaculum pumilum]|uniref:VWA domain-containing protein n=1 Tax=Marinibaculum pumilum TaxID=1766165 RepID=A0ABV7KZG8_9PROT
MLLDASGSMGDDNRIGEAKGGISEAVRSLQPNDEAALIVFFTCGDIRVVVPFTDDPEEILEGLAGIAPSGGTPLGDGIRFANRYLSDNARYQERKLLTFSDRETTCGAGATTAVAEIAPDEPEEPAAEEAPEEEERPREIGWSAYRAGTDDSPYMANYWVDVIEYRESDFDDPARDSAALTVRRHPVAYVSSRGRTV